MTSVQNSPRLQQPQEQQQQQQQLSLKIKQLKLKRINELNNKLRKELSRERITASNACLTIINYTSNTKDYTLPELWGYPVAGSNHFIEGLKMLKKIAKCQTQIVFVVRLCNDSNRIQKKKNIHAFSYPLSPYLFFLLILAPFISYSKLIQR